MKTRYSLQSPLSESIQSFLSYHRALGKRFESEEDALRLLDRYLCEQDVTTLAQVTPQLLEDFLVSRPRTRGAQLQPSAQRSGSPVSLAGGPGSSFMLAIESSETSYHPKPTPIFV